MTFKFVICGLEHSGTTLLSDLFRQVKHLDSGFEVGVLLGKSPRDFPGIQPFYNNMIAGWKIESDVLQRICETDDFGEFYTDLKANSQVITSEITDIFDKTPRYFTDIYSCQQKAKVPVIGLYKDPRSLVYSDYKRSGKPQNFVAWYEAYKKPKLAYLERVYQNSYLKWKKQQLESSSNTNDAQVICASLENICLNTRTILEQIFAHANCEFNLEYLMLKNLRYEHTRQPQISSRIPFEYLEGLTKEQIALIQIDFASLEDWFYL